MDVTFYLPHVQMFCTMNRSKETFPFNFDVLLTVHLSICILVITNLMHKILF